QLNAAPKSGLQAEQQLRDGFAGKNPLLDAVNNQLNSWLRNLGFNRLQLLQYRRRQARPELWSVAIHINAVQFFAGKVQIPSDLKVLSETIKQRQVGIDSGSFSCFLALKAHGQIRINRILA